MLPQARPAMALLTLPLGLGVWSFVWALGSKLFRHGSNPYAAH